MSKIVCKKCGIALQAKAAGRPPDYCSVGCRRAVEFEKRRISGHLERLETELILLESAQDIGIKDTYGRTHNEQITDRRTAITKLEARLAELLETNAA